MRTNPIYVLRVGDALRVFSTDEQARISFTDAPRRPIYGSEESFAEPGRSRRRDVNRHRTGKLQGIALRANEIAELRHRDASKRERRRVTTQA